MYGKTDLEKDLIELVNKVEYNHETRGDLEGLFQYCSQRFRGHEMKAAIVSKRSGGKTQAPAPPPVNPLKKNVFQPAEEKKTEMTNPVAPDSENQAAETPEPVKANPTNDMKILDLFSEGLEKTKAKYLKPSEFKKELASVGIKTKAKYDKHPSFDLKLEHVSVEEKASWDSIWDTLWSALKTEFDKINS